MIQRWKPQHTTMIAHCRQAFHTVWGLLSPHHFGKVSHIIHLNIIIMIPMRVETPTIAKPPSPRVSGEIDDCLSWVRIDAETNCAAMVGNFQLFMSEFYEMNPSVGADCSNLSLGSYYCIETPDISYFNDGGDVTTTPSPTSTQPPLGSGSPSPVQVGGRDSHQRFQNANCLQNGSISGCTDFYFVVAGDGC